MISAIIRFVLTLLMQFRVSAIVSAAVLSLLGLYGFIDSLTLIPRDGIWLLILAILSLLWMALWGYVTYLAMTSPTWPPRKRR